MWKRTGKLPAFVFLVVLSSLSVGRAGVTISASLEPAETEVGRMVRYQVTVTADRQGIPSPNLPEIPDVEIVSRGTSQSVSIVNGQASFSVAHVFGLVPKREGTIEIPPSRLTVAGQVYETESFRLKVHPPGKGPQPKAAEEESQDAFEELFFDPFRPRRSSSPKALLRVVPDRTEVYAGEPVVLSWKLLLAGETGASLQGMSPLRLEGFWTEDPRPVPNARPEGRMTVDGVPYVVYTVQRQTVVPMSSGSKTIPSAEAVVVFESMFDRTRRELRSPPVVVEVKPLPPSAPADFRGAVGTYTIEAEADRTRLRRDEALLVRVKVSGRGNLRGLEEPVRPELPDFRIFKSTSSVRPDSEDGLAGTKVFEHVLSPLRSGRLTIPPFVLVVFDPARRTYRTLRTRPLVVEVESAPAGAGMEEGSGPADKEKRGTAETDIRSIRPVLWIWEGPPLHRRALPWAVMAADLLVLALAAVAGAERRRERPERAAKGRAYGGFRRRCREMEMRLREGKTAEAASLLGKALEEYVADRFGLGRASLTRAEVEQRLAGLFPPELVAEYGRLADEADAMKYAPSGAERADLERLVRSLRAFVERLEAGKEASS